MSFSESGAVPHSFAAGADVLSMNVKVSSSTSAPTNPEWVNLATILAPAAFNLTLLGGGTLATTSPSAPPLPFAIEWMLHGGVGTGLGPGCTLYDERECAAVITVVQGATLPAALQRQGTLLTVEGGLFNAYLLRARVVSPGVALTVALTLLALRAPMHAGGGLAVQVGALVG